MTFKPADNPLFTEWAARVSPETVHREYPRPQMTRKDWLNLNGLWEYAIVPVLEDAPGIWDGEILVPFGIESALSGVKKRVGPDHRLWYHKTFSIPEEWGGPAGHSTFRGG